MKRLHSSRRRIKLVLVLAVLGLNLFVAGIAGHLLAKERRAIEDRVGEATANLAQLVDQSISASVKTVDMTLLAVADELQRRLRQGERLDPAGINPFLERQERRLFPSARIRVTDESGSIVLGLDVKPGQGSTLGDLDFFKFQRSRPDAGMTVTDPFLGHLYGQWIISFARRYEHPDGTFAGVVSIAVPVAFFEQLLADLKLGPHGVALLRDSGTRLIAHWPISADPSAQIGARRYSRNLADIIASNAPTVTFHPLVTGDNVERINTYRRLGAVPFHLVVGMGSLDYLQGWRTEVRRQAIGLALLLLGSLLMAWLFWRLLLGIQRESRKSQIILQNASDGIHILDREGRVVEASESFCRMLGRTRQEVLGMHVSQWDASLPPEALEAQLAEQFQNPQTSLFETSHRMRDGSLFEVEVSGQALELDGQPVLFNASRDITRRKRAERAVLRQQAQLNQLNKDLEAKVQRRTASLEAANRELEAFSYSVSHDLRGPLRALDGFTKLLAEDNEKNLDADGRHYLARIRAAAQRMGTLIDDLLRLSRISRAELSLQPLDLSAIAARVMEECRQRDPWREAEVHIAQGAGAWADPHLLTIALENLLGNAWKYTSKTPAAEIWFEVGESDGLQVFCVRDNGAGFDPQYAAKLFLPFQRLHRPDEFEGTGIGLAIVQRILQRHGGRVWAEAQVGRGASFFFTLPPGEAGSQPGQGLEGS